ncbi:hypothetical protein BU16DRAFT_461503 [Lophium mytilinum]|uniref:Nuclear segregation protein n=1 Tax=Lophium mytilinum TaxID=390894 RepID=A0A6A6QTA4_9PEZI|nr:hypothetical protein BU16DRAFT_461503 [Lophium mytilinum]
MADVATPSAATLATSDATASTASAEKSKPQFVKPEKPDEEKFHKEEPKAKKEHAAAQEKFNAARAKQDLARPNNRDSPNAKRQQELKSELKKIGELQRGSKSGRNAIFEKMKKLDEQIKSRQNELKTAKGRINFRTVDDVDREIDRLQKQVDTGTMKLVDEKKALSEISSLHKARKNFATFDQMQKAIDELRGQHSEQKKLLDDPEQKALSDKYTVLQKELDGLKAEEDDAHKNSRSLKDEMHKAHAEMQEKWVALKEIRDNYHSQKKAFSDYDYQARMARREKHKQEQKEWEANKRKEVAAQKLEEASAPAYQDDIITAEGLIRYFDPSAVAAKEESAPSQFTAAAQRTVDAAGLKGTKLVKKDEEEYFMGTGGKKGKKGKKTSAPKPAAEGKFNLSIGVIEQLSKIGVDAPSSQAGVPAVVEKLKEKLDFWKKDQDRKTKENVAKAQKEIDRLEAAEDQAEHGSKDTARKPAQKNQAVNGGHVSATAELEQEKDAVADAAEDLKVASLEDGDEVLADA